jgi:hypothetical protein
MLATIAAPQTTPHPFIPITPVLPVLPRLPILPDLPDLPERIKPTHIQFDDSMVSHHTCPCCSSILLRHVSRSRVYWRCSRCRAPMSAWRQFE